jgi:hypothetical protein
MNHIIDGLTIRLCKFYKQRIKLLKTNKKHFHIIIIVQKYSKMKFDFFKQSK